MERPSLDEYYIDIAKAVSERSTCLKKHYGAVIVNNGELVSSGYNNPPRGEPHCLTCNKKNCGKDMSTFLDCRSVHAEMNCIISASRREMLGATLYLYGYDVELGKDAEVVKPCEICARLIKNSGITRVYTSSGLELLYNNK